MELNSFLYISRFIIHFPLLYLLRHTKWKSNADSKIEINASSYFLLEKNESYLINLDKFLLNDNRYYIL